MKIATHWRSIITKLGIGCVICLFLGVAVLLYAQERTGPRFIGTSSEMDTAQMREMAAARMQRMNNTPGQAQPQRNRTWGGQNRGGGVNFGENAAFYRTIIDNNLFRPLGWTPPKNEPSYVLEGTAVDENGVISQATLLERRSNRYHFVAVGTKLDDMTVKEIQAKQVIMDKEGETVTLKIGSLQLLTTKHGNEGHREGGRGEGGSERADNNNAGQNRAAEMAAEKRRQAEQKKREYSREQMRREAMEKLRHASSPEERREIIEWMRKEFGGDRRRRDR